MSSVVTEENALTQERDALSSTYHRARGIMETVARQGDFLAWPVATYRVQFNHLCTFATARAGTAYWHRLGISHVYASPYLMATPGSEHGYDAIDHHRLNPDIGSREDYTTWIKSLRQHGMGHILDFVPNHMGVGTDLNPWWQHVLEQGEKSPYASYFDIDWDPIDISMKHKILLPVLGDHLGRVLENQELLLALNKGAFSVRYYDRSFPIDPATYWIILESGADDLKRTEEVAEESLAEYTSIMLASRNLAPSNEHSLTDQDYEREITNLKRRLSVLYDSSTVCRAHIDAMLIKWNGSRGDSRSFDPLEQLLKQQNYRLAYWKVAADEINYRRFFDVDALAAICMESPRVFRDAHALVLELIATGQLDGLRIDHADGLSDPAGYLRELQHARFVQRCRDECERIKQPGDPIAWDELEQEVRRTLERDDAPARGLYVVAEKILERDERLPSDWPVAGTTGYDFLGDVNGLFVDSSQEMKMRKFYARFIGESQSFDDHCYRAKRLIMKVAMASEINMLGHQLNRISEGSRLYCDFTLNGLTSALREVIACFPVYRTYIRGTQVAERDRKYIEQAVARAKRRNPAVFHAVFDFIQEVLLLQGFELLTTNQQQQRLAFVRKFQQYTGPVMAKSVEDTVFYRYNVLVSLNEVGSDPSRFGITSEVFHAQNASRPLNYPRALLATSTHDTKRSEDCRTRINVLSEIPGEWGAHVMRWARWNRRKKRKVDGELAPSRNDEYLLYQTLIGTYRSDEPNPSEYVRRIEQYMVKALREAKVHSSWIAPHEDYEKAMAEFISAILGREPRSAFLVDFEPFVERVAEAGYWNALSQTLLKIASPGVPDFYPGTELWNLRLVDPDNRVPVDFESLSDTLQALQRRMTDTPRAELLSELVRDRADGRIKMFVTHIALQARLKHPDLFTGGDYVPFTVAGDGQDQVVAFGRRMEDKLAVVVAPRLLSSFLGDVGQSPVGHDRWQGTSIRLPAAWRHRTWRNVFIDELSQFDHEIPAHDAFAKFPVAMWISEERQPHRN